MGVLYKKSKAAIVFVLVICLFAACIFESSLGVQSADSQPILIKISETARVGNSASGKPVAFNSKEDEIGKLKGSGEDLAYATIYYKADLSAVTTSILSAKLKVNVKVQSQGDLQVYEVLEDWDKDTISHEKSPAVSETPIAEISKLAYSSGAYDIKELDITNYLRDVKSKGNNNANLMIAYMHTKDERYDTRLVIHGPAGSVPPVIEVMVDDAQQPANGNNEQEGFSGIILLTKMNILRSSDQLPEDLNKSITRAEFIHYALRLFNLGDGDFTGVESVFQDVKKESPFYGSIAVAEKIGLIHGDYGDSFRPDDPITYNEAIKIIVCSLGYEPKAMALGGYPSGYMSVAADAGLLRKIGSSMSGNPVTFDAAFKLLYYSLGVPILDTINYGSSPKYSTDKDKTLLSEKFNVKKVKGIVTANKHTALTFGGRVSRGAIWIDGAEYRVSEDAMHELLGYYVECYYKENSVSGENEVIHIDSSFDRNEITTVEAEDIIGVNNMTLSYYKDGRTATIKIDAGDYVIYNGKAINKETQLNDELFKISIGDIKILNNGSGSLKNVIFISDCQSMVVQGVNPDTHIIYDKFDSAKNLSLNLNSSGFSYSIIDKKGNLLEFTQLREWDVLWVMKSKDNNLVKIMVSRTNISGEISNIVRENDLITQVTIDNTQYDVLEDANNSEIEFVLNRRGTFYLDFQGNIAAIQYQTLAGSKFGYILELRHSTGLIIDVQIEMLVVGAEEPEIFECAEKVEFDGRIIKKEQLLEKLKSGGKTNRQGIYFKTNEDKKITMIDTAAYDPKYENEDSLTIRKSNEKLRHKNDKFGSNYPLVRGKTLVVNVNYPTVEPGQDPKEPEREDYDIVTNPLGQDAEIEVVALYSLGKLKPELDIVVIKNFGGTGESVGEQAELSIVEKITTTFDSDGQIYKKLTVFSAIALASREIKVLEEKYDLIESLDVGDIIRYAANSRAELRAIQVYYDYSENKVLMMTDPYYFGMARVCVGKVYMKEDGYIRVARDLENISDDTLETQFIADKNIIMYEVNGKKLHVEKVKYEDILDYVHSGDDAADVAIHTRYGDFKSMLFVKGRPMAQEPFVEDGPHLIKASARIGIKDGVPQAPIFDGNGAYFEDSFGRNSGNSSTYAKLYYKVDLSRITSPVKSAKLVLYAKCYTGNVLYVYPVLEEWDKTTITFENQPPVGSAIAQQSLTAAVNEKYDYLVREIDITGYIQQLQASGNLKNVSLMLDFVHGSTSGMDSRIVIHGIQKPSNSAPQIVIETEKDPIPEE